MDPVRFAHLRRELGLDPPDGEDGNDTHARDGA